MLTSEQRLGFYRGMLRIREFETEVAKCFRLGSIPGFVHLYIGEEAVAVGVCGALHPNDYVASTHRGHGHALAKGVPMRRAMAELWGREGGANRGRGGSMHIFDASVSFLGTNGLVAASIPIAAGAAFSAKYYRTGQVAVGFVGDGGTNHGAFLETLNLAAALNLPLIIVAENNQYATCTPYRSVTKSQDIAARGAAMGMAAETVDGNAVEAVYGAAREAAERARSGGGPTLLACQTYRTVGHYEGEEVAGTYRTVEELNAWKERDPIASYSRRLLASDGSLKTQLAQIKDEVSSEVADAVAFSGSSPFCKPEEATQHVIE